MVSETGLDPEFKEELRMQEVLCKEEQYQRSRNRPGPGWTESVRHSQLWIEAAVHELRKDIVWCLYFKFPV